MKGLASILDLIDNESMKENNSGFLTFIDILEMKRSDIHKQLDIIEPQIEAYDDYFMNIADELQKKEDQETLRAFAKLTEDFYEEEQETEKQEDSEEEQEEETYLTNKNEQAIESEDEMLIRILESMTTQRLYELGLISPDADSFY
ncbi:MAG: hypothetical protein ACRCZ0_02850 [Cetobacterium sp.]